MHHGMMHGLLEPSDRILKVSRSTAVLAAETDVTTEHLSETIQYRTLGR